MGAANPDAAWAEAKVSAPGTTMLVVGVLGIAFSAMMMLAALLMAVGVVPEGTLGGSAYGPSADEIAGQAIGQLCGSVLTLMSSALVTFAGWRMRHLESWTLSFIGGVLLTICCNGCSCWTFPVGIWVLVVLMDDAVRREFH